MAAQTTTVKISPSDDAYVAADLNDNGTDKLGLRSLNTGNLPILKVWYAWNLTIVNKNGTVVGYIPVKIVTVAYFKFDLSSIPSGQGVTNATLNLYAENSNLTGASRLMVAYYVPINSWSQTNVNWYSAPGFQSKVNASVSVTNDLKGWYSLPLTRFVQNATGKTLSIALTFLVLYKHNEEQEVFNSTRASGGQPYLSVTYNGSPPFSIGGLYDFSNGINSTNAIGILIIVVIVVAIVLAFWWWRRRAGRSVKAKGRAKELAVPKAPGSVMAKGAKCTNCGAQVQSDFKLCPECGRELEEKACGNCGKHMKAEFKVCPYCGNDTG
jgi:RNA polymerase subunit RPABC4/transcription elongation factor Spt4